jgi:hypothetical protein
MQGPIAVWTQRHNNAIHLSLLIQNKQHRQGKNCHIQFQNIMAQGSVHPQVAAVGTQ